jgi:hypothetical protein
MNKLNPALGTLILIALTGSAGYLAFSVAKPSFTFIKLPEIGSEEVALEATAEAPDLVPDQRPEIYFAAILDRPLFAQSRRPQVLESASVQEAPVLIPEPAPAPEPEAVILPEPNVALLGITAGGAQNSALISVEGAEPEWLEEGSNISGWRIEGIKPSAIELSESGRSLRIELYRK